MSGNITYFQFDRFLVAKKPEFLHNLAKFYCNVWRFDPNFAEYQKCPNCERYYSYQFVETEKNIVCPSCQVSLVEAWVESEVEDTILELTSLKKDFFGAVAVDNVTKNIIGFVWGLNKPLSKVETVDVRNAIQNKTGFVPYFNEIATDPAYRKNGVGSQLCRMLVEWMKNTSPETPGYLHTHENSPARRLFEKAGYSFLCYDEKLGGGRIFMSIGKCADFTPENL